MWSHLVALARALALARTPPSSSFTHRVAAEAFATKYERAPISHRDPSDTLRKDPGEHR